MSYRTCHHAILDGTIPPPQSWQCPCCRAQFAPSALVCSYCNPDVQRFASYYGVITHRCPKPQIERSVKDLRRSLRSLELLESVVVGLRTTATIAREGSWSGEDMADVLGDYATVLFTIVTETQAAPVTEQPAELAKETNG